MFSNKVIYGTCADHILTMYDLFMFHVCKSVFPHMRQIWIIYILYTARVLFTNDPHVLHI